MPIVSPVLRQALLSARHVLVFTGAGVSAESGVPTFRDALTGLWSRYDPMELATPEAFRRDPALVWGWYEWRRGRCLRAQPNPAHHAIAALAEQVAALTVVTQNVDDLHERAGSTAVSHLHGELNRARCADCGAEHVHPPGVPEEPEGGRRLPPPRCGLCGGMVRPGVVWFGESLPEDAWRRAMAAAAECDLLFCVGTSSLVQPAAALPGLARRAGARVVVVNPQPTPQDDDADEVLRGPAGEILPQLLARA